MKCSCEVLCKVNDLFSSEEESLKWLRSHNEFVMAWGNFYGWTVSPTGFISCRIVLVLIFAEKQLILKMEICFYFNSTVENN